MKENVSIKIDRNVYETTLDYLNNRIELHDQILRTTKNQKLIQEQKRLISDCRKIKSHIEETFIPWR